MVDKVKMQAVAGGGRICFRGDSRDPSEMFKRGFFSREKKSKWKFWQDRDTSLTSPVLIWWICDSDVALLSVGTPAVLTPCPARNCTRRVGVRVISLSRVSHSKQSFAESIQLVWPDHQHTTPEARATPAGGCLVV